MRASNLRLYKESGLGVTEEKSDKFLHFVLIFVTRERIVGLTIPHAALTVIGKIYITPKPNIFTEFEPKNFRSCVLFLKTSLPKRKFGLGDVLSSLVYELQKSYSSGLEHRTVFRNCSLYSCILLFETNDFVLDAVLIRCLVCEL